MKEKTGVSQLVSFIPDVEVGFRCTYDKKRITLVSAPLQLDKLHSSPKEVTTYYGLPVELRCAFKYGAPPVRVVIVRKEKIIANQENGTQKVKITVEGLNKDYGSYTCVAEDVNNNKITHQMEIKKIDPSYISTEGKKTTCTRDEMQLTLNRSTYPWLQPKYFDMHLLDNSCRPYHVNFTHIVVKTTYGNCKTVVKNSSHDVTYRNIFMAMVRTSSAKVITRVPNVWFPFQCRFDHTKMESTPFKLYEPLTADKSKSSPMIVKSYKRFKVRLVCTFKGGVPPVTIILTKGGRRLTQGVVVKRKVLYVKLNTSHRAAFGSYECIATDAKGNRVKQRITLQRAGANDITSDGLTVKCKSQYMDISISRLVYPWLDPNLLHMNFIQSNCTANSFTDTYVRIQAPLAGCGTKTLRKNEFVLESRNMFIARPKRPRGFSITYLPNIYFPIVCAYEITQFAGKTMLKAIETLTLDASESSSNTIFSPQNMAIKLRCVFQGGEPPIQVRISRLNKAKAHEQGRVLSFVMKPRIQDNGLYVCWAIDARNKTVTHGITLKVPVNRVIFNKGARIECGSQFTTTIVTRANYPWFNPRCMRMHLNDPGCRPYVNNTHVSFKFPLGACGSRHITSSRKVIFTNRVLIVNKPDYKEGGEKSIMEIHFYCKYRRTDSPNHKTKGFL